MFKSIISAAIVASIAFTSVGNAAINGIGEQNKKNIITSCLKGYEHSCTGVLGNYFYTVDKPNKSLIEVYFRSFNFTSSDDAKSYIKEEITKKVILKSFASEYADAKVTISSLRAQITALTPLIAQVPRLAMSVRDLTIQLNAELVKNANLVAALSIADDGITAADVAEARQEALTSSYDAVQVAAGTYANNARIAPSEYLSGPVTLADIRGAVERLSVVLDTFKASIHSARAVTATIATDVNAIVSGLISTPSYDRATGTFTGYSVNASALDVHIATVIDAKQAFAMTTLDAKKLAADNTHARNFGAVTTMNGATFSQVHSVATVGFSTAVGSTGEYVYTGVVSIQQNYVNGVLVDTYTADLSAINTAVTDAFNDGYDSGYEDGYDAGYTQGFSDGVASVN